MNKDYDLENSKFEQFVIENGFEHIDDIDEELNENAHYEDCTLTEFDDDFPLQPFIDDNDKQKEIFRILQQCYKHGSVEINHLFSAS